MACRRCGSEVPEGARFCPTCGAEQADSVPQEERKVVSILFVDIVGSTAHADGADPEDVRERNQVYYHEMRERIERYGGGVEKYIGDAVMAVFGAPLARSDDAERSVRAALSALQGVRELNERHIGLDLEIRAAVCSGEAMVAINAAPGDALATGDVVNTASRLQSAAPIGRVVVGEDTYQLTKHAFTFEKLAPVVAKGKRDTVAAWLVGEPLVSSANRPTSRTPLVGRDREVSIVRTVWERAMNASRPHLVTALGPAGIGKTRLALEVAAEIEAQGGRALWGRSLPYEEQSPYRAAGQILRLAAGIYENDSADTAREKLAILVRSLCPDPEAPETTRYLSLLLGLGLDEPASEVVHLQFAMRRFVEVLSQREPLLLVFEDIHWADDAMLDLIDYLVTHVHDHRILFLALARPEFLEARPNWGAGMAGTMMLPLEPLTRIEASEVIGSLLSAANAITVERVVATAGGNPLFIEELAASLADDPASQELPGTVRAAISARIDALPTESRSTLLSASVIGQTFWRGVLADVGETPDVDGALEALEARGLVQRRSTSQVEGDVEFGFKHVLIRDTAYGTLPRAARRKMHAAIAAHLERSVSDSTEIGWILAHHWREAGEPVKAIVYLLRAAERTADALAVEETWDLYTRALDLAGPDDERRAIRLKRGLAMAKLENFSRAKGELEELVADLDGSELIEALIAEGHSTLWTEDSEKTMEIATRAVELAESANDAELLPPAQSLLSSAYGMRGDAGDLERADELGVRAFAAWVPGTRREWLAEHHHMQANHRYWMGRYDGALEQSQLAKESAGGEPHSAEFLLRGAGMQGLAFAGLGRYEEAISAVETAISIARSIGRPIAVVTNYSTMPLRDIFAAEEAHTRSSAIADSLGPSDFNMPWINARADVIAADMMLGELGRVEATFPQAWEDAVNSLAWERWLVSGRLASVRAELALAMKQPEDAITWARRAQEMARGVGRKKYEVISTMTLGAALTLSGLAEDARTELRTAVAQAEALGSPLYRWQTLAALAEAVRKIEGVDAADALLAEAAAIIREVIAGLSQQHGVGYIAAPQVAAVLAAV
ncbi:MAG: adenylate/guanylate cyclase domain-containing protein [Actinomycetota bacterium]